VDADAIFCYQCVRRMNEQAHIVVEIVRHTNVSYLGKILICDMKIYLFNGGYDILFFALLVNIVALTADT